MVYSSIMPKEYHLKLDPLVKEIVKFYIKFEKSEIVKGKTVASHLKPVVYERVNKMLDFFEVERDLNPKMAKDLQKPEYQKILNLLNMKRRIKQ